MQQGQSALGFQMRIYTITMGFVPNRIWKQSVESYYRHAQRKTEHIFVDQHYPLNENENRRALWQTCCDHGISVIDPGRNLGGVNGFNYAIDRINPNPEDVIIGYDPDSFAISPGWDGALVDAIALDPKINWTSLMSDRAKPELQSRGYDKRFVSHIEVWKTRQPVVNSVCAFRAGWLKSIGGLGQNSAWYGGLETKMFESLRGGEWCFVPGWFESDEIRNQQDREYLWWKWMHAHLHEWPGDFKSYVAAGCPPPSDLPNYLP